MSRRLLFEAHMARMDFFEGITPPTGRSEMCLIQYELICV
jgi:hypothetical protein